MQWNDHSRLKDQHAFLSCSQWHWMNYDDDKLISRWKSAEAVKEGTLYHEYAAMAIRLGRKQLKNNTTLNMHINDAIGFGLDPEVTLYYSENCFGTSDAIGFKNNILRIHDLKTGQIKAHMEQLRGYAALFCLEYAIKPGDIDLIELRIYQNNEIVVEQPKADLILPIMDKMQRFDKIINDLKKEKSGIII